MEKIKNTIQSFIYIVAGITFSAAIFITLFVPDFLFSYQLIWQIIGMSAVCAGGDLIYFSKGELSKQQMKIRMIFHYLYINLVVFGGAFFLRWLGPGLLLESIVMFLLVAVVYVGVTMGTLRQEKKTAKNLNLRLRKYQQSEDDKEEW